MSYIREFKESPLVQGEDEIVAYDLTTTPWGGSPASSAAVIKDPKGRDVSATCLAGSASEAGDVITTPLVQNLTSGIRYRLEVQWTSGGNTLEAFGFIDGEV